MLDEVLKKLILQGKLKEQNAGFSQIEGLLLQAVVDLKEARKTVGLAERATYILAYMAMLKAGRALLLMEGYVPSDGAQHKTVVSVTQHLLGSDFKTITLHFEMMRRKRNEMTYEAGGLLSGTESRKAFDDAIVLVQGIWMKVKEKNPQMKFNFEKI